MQETLGRSLIKIYELSQWDIEDTNKDLEVRLNDIRDEVKYLIDPTMNPNIHESPRLGTHWFKALLKMKLPSGKQ